MYNQLSHFMLVSSNKKMNNHIKNSATEHDLQIFTVTQFSSFLKKNLENSIDLVWISGEISGLFKAQSGHIYCQIKDQTSQIRLVIFKGVASSMLFNLEEGMQVIVCAQVSMYQPRGELQIIARKVEPEGLGALKAAYDQLKKKLLDEGLFEESLKKSLPKKVSTLGLITSKDGAVVHDMIHVIRRRNPLVKIIHYVTPVQGKGAIEKVVSILKFAAFEKKCDAYILARGGGSLEDLWTFNTESVVRAVADFPFPIISAIGHETDHSLCDYVADLRAPTPSIAAELATVDFSKIDDFFSMTSLRIHQAIKKKIQSSEQNLDYKAVSLKKKFSFFLLRAQDLFQRFYKVRQLCLHKWKYQVAQINQCRIFFLIRYPQLIRKIITRHQKQLCSIEDFMIRCHKHQYQRLEEKLLSAFEKFSLSSYRKNLERGFSLVIDSKGQTIRKMSQIKKNTPYTIQFIDGKVKMVLAQKDI
jgi:exodeoxyribonuclease VII large subunit